MIASPRFKPHAHRGLHARIAAMPDHPYVDALVIGAGAAGLCIARALALAGLDVAVLESERAPGQHTSSRNSEVIHAGFYYPSDSLKAQLCVRGSQLLYEYCAGRGITTRRCGKLVVTDNADGIDRLHALLEQGISNGVTGLTLVTTDQLRQQVPGIMATTALHSPATGIIDSHAYLACLQQDIRDRGGIIACGARFLHADRDAHRFRVSFTDDEGDQVIMAARLVNAAGLFASEVARNIDGLPAAAIPETRWAKGNYFSLAGRPPCQTLVYPLPERHGLGIHLTLDTTGSARFGPDVVWTERVDYRADEHRRAVFAAAVARYFPGIDPARLQPAWAGIRPKAFQGGAPVNDFVIQGPTENGVPGLVQLFGIESPGLTASLAIGERCAALLEGTA